jgi:mRNA interferase RelE/StbE
VGDYRIEFLPASDRQLKRLPRDAQKRIADALERLATDPRPASAKRLIGKTEYWRIRVGPYRVVYAIEDDRLVVAVVRIGPRGSVYRNL